MNCNLPKIEKTTTPAKTLVAKSKKLIKKAWKKIILYFSTNPKYIMILVKTIFHSCKSNWIHKFKNILEVFESKKYVKIILHGYEQDSWTRCRIQTWSFLHKKLQEKRTFVPQLCARRRYQEAYPIEEQRKTWDKNLSYKTAEKKIRNGCSF